MPKTKSGGWVLDDSDFEHVKILPPKTVTLGRLKDRVQTVKTILKGKDRG